MNALVSYNDETPEVLWRKVKLTSVAINSNYNDYNLYCRRASLYEKLGMYRLSLDDATKAISLNQIKFDAYLYQSQAYVGLKLYSEAEQVLFKIQATTDGIDLVRPQLNRLRFLALREIGFDDRTSELVSSKFNTVSEAIEGALNMDLDCPVSSNSTYNSTTIANHLPQQSTAYSTTAVNASKSSLSMSYSNLNSTQMQPIKECTQSDITSSYLSSTMQTSNQANFANQIHSNVTQPTSICNGKSIASYGNIHHSTYDSIAPTPLQPMQQTNSMTTSSGQTMISNNIVTNIIKIATPKKKQKRKSLYCDLMCDGIGQSSMLTHDHHGSPAKVMLRSQDNYDNQSMMFDNSRHSNTNLMAAPSMVNANTPVMPTLLQQPSVSVDLPLNEGYERVTEDPSSVNSFNPDAYYTSEDQQQKMSVGMGSQLDSQFESQLESQVSTLICSDQIDRSSVSAQLIDNRAHNQFDSNASEPNPANINEMASSDELPSETNASNKLPAYTPVKDFFRDIENEFFCSDFNTSPFSRGSNSSYSLVDSLSTPQVGDKCRELQSRATAAKPEAIKNLANDLSENVERSSVLSFSPLSSPSKANLAPSSPTVVSSPRVLSVQSPRINLPSQITVRQHKPNEPKAQSQSTCSLSIFAITKTVPANRTSISKQQENEHPHRIQNPNKLHEKKMLERRTGGIVRSSATSISLSVCDLNKTKTSDSTTIKNPATSTVLVPSAPVSVSAPKDSSANDYKTMNPYLGSTNNVKKRTSRKCNSKLRIETKVQNDSKALKKTMKNLKKVQEVHVGFNPIELALPVSCPPPPYKPNRPKEDEQTVSVSSKSIDSSQLTVSGVGN